MREIGPFGWLVTILALSLLFGLAINASAEHTTTQQTVDNESITVDYQDPVRVDAPADALNWSHTVTITNDGTTLDPGTDYKWSGDTGEVTFINTSATTSGETVAITYSYGVHTTATTRTVDQLLTTFQWIGVLGLAVTVGYAGYNLFKY